MNTLLVFSYIYCPHGLVLQVLGVLLQLRGNEGENASERHCSSWRNSGASPLHALHFLPTGTSKQDLSGMKSAWHRNVLDSCCKVCLHWNQIIPLLLNISQLFLENPKEWSHHSLWNWFDCCMLPKYSLKTLLILWYKACRPYLTRSDKNLVNNPIKWETPFLCRCCLIISNSPSQHEVAWI